MSAGNKSKLLISVSHLNRSKDMRVIKSCPKVPVAFTHTTSLCTIIPTTHLSGNV
jgi:hypothetical protein